MVAPPRRSHRRVSTSLAAIALACLAIADARYANHPVIAAAAAGETRAAEWSRAQDAAPPPYTIQTRVPLTIVDVTVTDAQGNPVHGLKQSDFTILEDGEEMQPNSFEEHRSDQTPPPLIQAKQALPPNTFTNADPTDGHGPINVLLIDTLNIGSMTQLAIQQQMLDWVKKAPAGTRLAVFRLTSYLTILQGITTDRDLIMRAIQKRDFAPGAPLPSDASAAQEPPSSLLTDTPNAKASGGSTVAGEFQASRGQYTLQAMKSIAQYLDAIPGRKNLIWFTGAFDTIYPEPDPNSPELVPGSLYNFTDDLTSETDLLARSHITVFPICFGNYWEKLTMDSIAEGTGGKRLSTGNLATSVSRAIGSGSNYYALTYVPTNQAIDSGHFRTITVEVNRPGVQLAYRPGYYGTDPTRSLTNMKLLPHATAMQGAMLRGGLQPTQILFDVKVEPASTDAKPSPGNQLDPKRAHPPYRHLAVAYTIRLDGISFTPSADGQYHADFEFGIMVYTADGQLINTVSNEVRPVLTQAAYQSMLQHGAAAHLQVDVPDRGQFFLRIGVHDMTSDHVGALEVPASSIKPDPVPAVASRSNP